MEAINQAIASVEEDLAARLEDLADAVAIVKGLEQEIATLRGELSGMRSFVERRGDTEPAPRSVLSSASVNGGEVVPINAAVAELQPARAAGPDLRFLSRNEAVATVLSLAPGPVDRIHIQEQLVNAGRFDSVDEVSLALTGLKRSGRVINPSRGSWTVSPDPSLG